MKLTIDRDYWIRGCKDMGISALRRNQDQKMCCLGFLALESGLTESEIVNLCTPAETHDPKKWPSGILGPKAHTWYIQSRPSLNGVVNSDLTNSLMNVNDDPLISEADRESELTRLFATINIEVEFV